MIIIYNSPGKLTAHKGMELITLTKAGSDWHVGKPSDPLASLPLEKALAFAKRTLTAQEKAGDK